MAISESNHFWRLMRAENNSVAGHEDFVTEALAFVLSRDPSLAKFVFESLLGIDVGAASELSIKTQAAYRVDRVGWSYIDMEVKSSSALIFVENKIEAKLNNYVIESEASDEHETVDQLFKYNTVLRSIDSYGSSQKHLLAIVQIPLEQPSRNLSHFRRVVLWWEVFFLVRTYLERLAGDIERNSPAHWLAAEFLRFLELGNLNPPKAIRKNGFHYADSVRLLAEAIQRSRLYSDASRAQSGRGFSVQHAGRNFVIWFGDDRELKIFERRVGMLKPANLDSDFWSGDSEMQILKLACALQEVPTLNRDESAPLDLTSALEQFGDRSELVKYFVTTICDIWPQQPKTGRGTSNIKEIRMSVGTMRVGFAPYVQFDSILLAVEAEKIQEVTEMMVTSVPDLVSRRHVTKKQFNIPLADIGTTSNADRVISVIQRLASRYTN